MTPTVAALLCGVAAAVVLEQPQSMRSPGGIAHVVTPDTAGAVFDVTMPNVTALAVAAQQRWCFQQHPYGIIDIVDNRAGFPALLNRLGLTGFGAELGVLEAKYSEHVLSNWAGKRLFMVDPWESQDAALYHDVNNRNASAMQGLFEQATARVRRFGSRAQVVRAYSHDAAPLFPDGSLDFVYIDANHAYEAVRRDLHDWWPKLRPGGMMAGHDYVADGQYVEGTFGVRGAVAEFTRPRCIQAYAGVREEEHGIPSFYFFKPFPVASSP